MTVATGFAAPCDSTAPGSFAVHEKEVSNSMTRMTVSMEHMRCAFKPKGVAVVGATEREGSVGRTTLENLMNGYKNVTLPFKIFPVNPTRQTVLGLKCYPSVAAIDDPDCEQVVVITPATKCADVARDCAKNPSVRVMVVIAAGFKEVGAEGAKLEQELVAIASAANIAVVGPNCLGIQCPPHRMNATFAADSAKAGHTAFISQSGAMCTAVLDWALAVGIGFSSFISIGNMASVEWADMIRYLGDDEETNAITMYMETIGNARKFMEAARLVAQKKPIILIKAGKTEAAAEAAVSHTGSLAGSHDAFLAAMKRAGVLVVDTIDELQNCIMLTSMQPKPASRDLVIITNAGGPGVLSTDAAVEAGLNLVDLSEEMKTELSSFLPAAWSHHNPVDIIGDAKSDVYGKSVATVLRKSKPGTSILVVLSPQSVTEPDGTAKAVVEEMRKYKTSPEGAKSSSIIMCAWMGGSQVVSGRQYLIDHGIPCFSMPDNAAKCLGNIARQVEDAGKITQVVGGMCMEGRKKAMSVMEVAKKEGRTILTESESKAVIKAFGIPVAESVVCNTADEAVKAAEECGYPCVLKLNSESITHKSDVGGVKLNIKNSKEVQENFEEIKKNVEKINPKFFQGVSVQPMLDISQGVEVLVGSVMDVQLGPMVMFGSGGCLVEVYKDACMGIPPFDYPECEALVKSTKISKALVPGHGDRFKGCPLPQLYSSITKFGTAMLSLWDLISECEINPLLALPDKIIALDARVVLRSDQPAAPPCLVD